MTRWYINHHAVLIPHSSDILIASFYLYFVSSFYLYFVSSFSFCFQLDTIVNIIDMKGMGLAHRKSLKFFKVRKSKKAKDRERDIDRQ